MKTVRTKIKDVSYIFNNFQFLFFCFNILNSFAEFAVRSARVHQLAAVDWSEFPSMEKRGIHARFPQQTQVFFISHHFIF
jgi:hypothetical protein